MFERDSDSIKKLHLGPIWTLNRQKQFCESFRFRKDIRERHLFVCLVNDYADTREIIYFGKSNKLKKKVTKNVIWYFF